ncbi:MAG: ABC transporter permease [Opitutae bacterium]|nr:ABC transporter permease [Opitutae bacterium]
MNLFLYELALAWHRLRRRRLHSAIMLGTFAFSIGLSLFSYSLFHAIFIKNPTFDPEGNLCLIEQVAPGHGDVWQTASPFEVRTWTEQQAVFSEFAPAVLYRSIFLGTPDRTERVLGANLSSGVLRMLGARPLHGRLFTAEEDKQGTAPVILLSHRTWQTRFGGDLTILGRQLLIDAKPATVVGIMPPEFRFPNDQEVWLSLGFNWAWGTSEEAVFDVVARLKPGQTHARAAADLEQINRRISSEVAAARQGLQPIVMPFRHYYLQDQLRTSALVLFGLSLIFVLMSSANIANLVMIDFIETGSELGVKAALGISAWSMVRHIVLRIFLLTLLSAMLGLLIAVILTPAFYQMLPASNLPFWLHFEMEWHLIYVALGLALTATAVATVGPAGFILLTKPETLIANTLTGARHTGHFTWKRAILIGQMALLTILGIISGLLVCSNYNLGHIELGFNPDNILTLRCGMRVIDYPTQAARRAAWQRSCEALRQLPGVTQAVCVREAPMHRGVLTLYYATQRDGLAEGRSEGSANQFLVTNAFFDLLRIPLIAGEGFRPDEPAEGPNYAVITRGLAEKLWPGKSALGRSFFVRVGTNLRTAPQELIVKGVAADFRSGPAMGNRHDAVFTSILKSEAMFYDLLVRGEQAPPSLEAVRETMRQTEPKIPLYFPNTYRGMLQDQLKMVELTSLLTLVYAVAAGLLCLVGVYSVTVSQLLQQKREYGIRLALGGPPFNLWLRFAGSYVANAVVGVAVGAGLASLCGPMLAALLYNVGQNDAAIFAIISLGIIGLSALACLPSLVRLLRIDPASCLRSL